jgi:radical SAM-linked protein
VRKVRIRFSKLGRARFISHLDLNRCMARAVKRSGLPVWYTEGFNPHPYITFALPLSIFFGSRCEAMDLRLGDDVSFEQAKERLGAQMPEGIEILEVSEPVMKVSEIAFAKYLTLLDFGDTPGGVLSAKLEDMLALPELKIDKETKHAVRTIDVKPIICAAGASHSAGDGFIRIEALYPAGQDNINPSCAVTAISRYTGLEPELADITREQIYDSNLAEFR